jgi:hypothetical protein
MNIILPSGCIIFNPLFTASITALLETPTPLLVSICSSPCGIILPASLAKPAIFPPVPFTSSVSISPTILSSWLVVFHGNAPGIFHILLGAAFHIISLHIQVSFLFVLFEYSFVTLRLRFPCPNVIRRLHPTGFVYMSKKDWIQSGWLSPVLQSFLPASRRYGRLFCGLRRYRA